MNKNNLFDLSYARYYNYGYHQAFFIREINYWIKFRKILYFT